MMDYAINKRYDMDELRHDILHDGDFRQKVEELALYRVFNYSPELKYWFMRYTYQAKRTNRIEIRFQRMKGF